MKMRVVLARPVYQGNLGAVARVMKNFGFKELALVKPAADKRGFTAKLYAKHSEDVLRKAKTYSSLRKATKGFFVVGTTGVVNRFKMKKCVSLKKLGKIPEKTALVFGNEGTGLSQRELSDCDVVVTIPTSSEHKVLNLSHAVGIVCFELFQSKATHEFYDEASPEQKQTLKKMLSKASKGLDYVRNKNNVSKAFNNIIGRSRISREEAQAIMAFLAGVIRKSSRRQTGSQPQAAGARLSRTA